MARKHVSARGKQVDMERMRIQNEGVAAVTAGTQSVNARGDVLGAGGKIVKTREQVLSEYNRVNPKAVPDEHIIPDVIGVSPPPEVIEDPFEEAELTEEERVAIDQQTANIAADANARVAALREKRQHEALKAQQEKMMTGNGNIAEVPVEVVEVVDNLIEQFDTAIEDEVSVNVVEEPIVNEEVFVDEVTGKEYKTKRGLRNAVARREEALQNKDEGKAKTEWA